MERKKVTQEEADAALDRLTKWVNSAELSGSVS